MKEKKNINDKSFKYCEVITSIENDFAVYADKIHDHRKGLTSIASTMDMISKSAEEKLQTFDHITEMSANSMVSLLTEMSNKLNDYIGTIDKIVHTD